MTSSGARAASHASAQRRPPALAGSLLRVRRKDATLGAHLLNPRDLARPRLRPRAPPAAPTRRRLAAGHSRCWGSPAGRRAGGPPAIPGRSGSWVRPRGRRSGPAGLGKSGPGGPGRGGLRRGGLLAGGERRGRGGAAGVGLGGGPAAGGHSPLVGAMGRGRWTWDAELHTCTARYVRRIRSRIVTCWCGFITSWCGGAWPHSRRSCSRESCSIGD
jgi:hypothetical protein